MRHRIFLTPAAALLLAGCAETTAERAGSRPEPQPLPAELRLAGEPGPGATISDALAADGISVAGAYAGRAQGVRAFCSGAADGVALSSDFTDAEAAECKSLGGGWSALSGPSGTILYANYAYADALLAESAAF
jgi:hypothetical protein